MTLDGSASYMAAASSLEGILGVTGSLSLWIKTTEQGSNQIFNAPNFTGIEESGGAVDIFYGGLTNQENVRMQRGNGTAAQSTTSINGDTWQHVVLTADTTTGAVEVYIDGLLEDSQTSATGDMTTHAFSDIGRMTKTGGGAEFFGGTYDDVRIYDRILSAAEVATIHASRGTDGIVEGLRNRWRMNEGAEGVTASGSGQNKDIAADGNDGTPTASPFFAAGELRFRRRTA